MSSGKPGEVRKPEDGASRAESTQVAKPAVVRVEPTWRRAWAWLHSRFARQIAVVAVALGGLAAAGHFIGGMIGWWEAYKITFGGHATDRASPAPTGPGTRADVQSLVVLPLVDESEGHTNDWFVDVLTSDLTAEIGRVPGVLVISRDTARTYKGKAVDPREVARDLSVRYVIRGSARRVGERVRLDLEMVDGDTGLQSWSQRIDVDRARLAGGLGDVALQLARSLNVQTYRTSGEKVAALKPNEVQADDLAMQGWATYFHGMTPENIREAAGLFEQAVERDPRSIRAWGGVAFTNSVGAALGWMPDRAAALRRLEEATARLRQIDENAFFTILARINLANRTGDWHSTLTLADTLLERFPSHAPSFGNRGQALIGLGRFDECFEPLRQALRISPRDPLVGSWHWMIANCHFMLAEYPQAEESARTAWRANPKLPLPPLTLAAALQREGKVDEAREIIADYRSRSPGFQIAQVQSVLPGTDPKFAEGRQRLIDSLRELGMP